jgi:hypothetical protein
VLILKKVKVVCFVTLLQVLILKGMEEVSVEGSRIGENREGELAGRRSSATNTRNGSMRGTVTEGLFSEWLKLGGERRFLGVEWDPPPRLGARPLRRAGRLRVFKRQMILCTEPGGSSYGSLRAATRMTG